MIRVRAPSRLHFGLLSAGNSQAPGQWADLAGQPTVPARCFGGVGIMIEDPGIDLSVEKADDWSAAGPGAARALAFAQQLGDAWCLDEAYRITIQQCPPEHVGLGTGTQLGLAVARALALATGNGHMDTPSLSSYILRGQRSALGIHGFDQGGFLVDGGKAPTTWVAPLLCRHAFPDDWGIVLVLPRGAQGSHGAAETEAFARLAENQSYLRRTDALCRLVLLGMLPALLEHDLAAFGEALYDFNARVGEMFAPWQGGLVSHPRTASLIRELRAQGIRGVGQSSWGPTIFAIVEAEHAPPLRDWICGRGWSDEEIVLTRAANRGAAHQGP